MGNDRLIYDDDGFVTCQISEQERKLIQATFFSDLEGIKSALEELPDKSFIEDIGLFSIPTSLYCLTLFNEIIWDTAYWDNISLNEEYRNVVDFMEERTKLFVGFWKEYLGVDELISPDIDKYDEMEIARMDDSITDEDILDGSKSDLLAKGFREIDIDLYIATKRVEFMKIDKLLQQGANPAVDLEENFSCDYCVYLEICYELHNLMPIYRKAYNGEDVRLDYYEFTNLLNFAVYMKMHKLFEKYEHIWDSQ